jgi:hypothetical protein
MLCIFDHTRKSVECERVRELTRISPIFDGWYNSPINCFAIFGRARKSSIFDIHPKRFNPFQDLNPEALSSRKVSISRITRLSYCGIKFKYKLIRHLYRRFQFRITRLSYFSLIATYIENSFL